jgi:hypothetical protein
MAGDPWAVVKSEPAKAGNDPWAVTSHEVESGPQMSIGERIGTGVLDPVYGTGQLLAHVMPRGTAKIGWESLNADRVAAGLPPLEGDPTADDPAKTADAEVKAREQRIKSGSPKGFDWWRLVGNIASPLNYLGPGGGVARAGMLARAGRGALQGAIVGAEQPVSVIGGRGCRKMADLHQGAGSSRR